MLKHRAWIVGLICILLMAAWPAAAENTLVIPEGVLRIEDEAFLSVSAEQAVLPEGITYIGERAFADSGIRAVNLPDSLTYIAPGAFDGCDGLIATVTRNGYGHRYCEDSGIECQFTEVVFDSSIYYGTETQSREMDTFNAHMSQSASDLNVLSNCVDGLLTNESDGGLTGALAEVWESADEGETWTFYLKDNATWVDYQGRYRADVTASDFATGLEWVLNEAKNESYNISMPIEMIQGAEEYYEYTRRVWEEEGYEAALALTASGVFSDMVGITVDDEAGTVTYHLTGPRSYFPSVTTFNCLLPLSASYLEEVGVEGYKWADYDTIWYNGPYTVTGMTYGVKKVLTKNESYYNPDMERFDRVVITMVDGNDESYELFEEGLADQVSLTSNKALEIYNDPEHPYRQYLSMNQTKYSYQMHFNYDKRISADDQTPDVAWNTAIADENFRLALYYGIDFTSYLARTNPITPLSGQNYTYSGRNLAVTSDGRDYTELVLDELGLQYDDSSYSRYDPELGRHYADLAKADLTAAGISLPVEAAYYVLQGNETALGTAQILKAGMEALLGDLVTLDIRTYTGSQAVNVRNPRVYSFMIKGWGADYADPGNFLEQETAADYAYYTNFYSNAMDSDSEALQALYAEYTEMVEAAARITGDLDARYQAFAEAEAFLVGHGLVLPVYVETNWQLSRVRQESKITVSYGNQGSRYVNWKKEIVAALD